VAEHLMVSVDEGRADSERMEQLTLALRRELLQLDVEDVEPVRTGSAPEGTRAIDVAAVGTLLVTLTSSAAALTGVVNTVRGWLAQGSQGRTVELTIGDKTLKLAGASDEQQDQLIREFLRSTGGG
jgi:hypothetical protein